MGWQDATPVEKKGSWRDAVPVNPPLASDDPGAGKGWPQTAAEWKSIPGRMLPGARGAALAAGASAGAVASLPVAPAAGPLAPLVPVVGGALGAAGASAGYDNINDLLKAVMPGFEGLPDATAASGDPRALDIGARAANEAAFDAALTAGTGIAGFPQKHFLTPLIGKLFGVRSPQALSRAELARRSGIELGAVDVGGAVPRFGAKVLGIFPLTGAPLRVARDAKEAQLESAVRRTLNYIAPTASLSQEMGINLAKAAQQSHGTFRSLAGVLYDRFRSSAQQYGAVIPTSDTKGTILKWLSDFREGDIPLPGSESFRMEGLASAGPVQGTRTLKGGINEEFVKFLDETSQLPDKLTMAQYETLQARYESFIDKLNPDPFTLKRVAQIKQAMERDLNAIADPTLKKLKEDADTFFSNGIIAFQTPTANKFRAFDKNIFKAGPHKPGTLNADELMKSVFNTDSPTALRQLRTLVGDDAFRRASRTHLQSSFEEAWKKEVRHGEEVLVFDPDAMANKIGLAPGAKDKRLALEEQLRGTGVGVQDVEDMLTRIKIAKQADPAAFASRRVTMGGVGALAGAIGGVGAAVGASVAGPAGAGVAVAGSPLITALVTWGAYNFSKMLASPQALKAFTRSFQPDINDVTRRAVYFRLLRELGDSREQQ
jgi:hypothetical protein